MTVMNINPR